MSDTEATRHAEDVAIFAVPPVNPVALEDLLDKPGPLMVSPSGRADFVCLGCGQDVTRGNEDAHCGALQAPPENLQGSEASNRIEGGGSPLTIDAPHADHVAPQGGSDA